MRAGDAPAFGAAAAANSGAAGLVTGAGAAASQGELGSARNPVYMMQVCPPDTLHTAAKGHQRPDSIPV